MNKVSIIGFGRFGAMLHALLSKGFEVEVFDKILRIRMHYDRRKFSHFPRVVDIFRY